MADKEIPCRGAADDPAIAPAMPLMERQLVDIIIQATPDQLRAVQEMIARTLRAR